jgi:secondary thiamine-phosphate synthase enzyme
VADSRGAGLRASVAAVLQHFVTLRIGTRGAGLREFTDEVRRWLHEIAVGDGLLTLFIRHTSASLVIQENADPDVCRDLDDFFRRTVPESASLYRHNAEGSDDMPAHIRAALTATQLSIPVREGRLRLGTWQGIYLFEHRAGAFERQVDLHFIGEA